MLPTLGCNLSLIRRSGASAAARRHVRAGKPNPETTPIAAVRATRSDAVRSEGVRHQSVRLDDGATYRTMCVRLCDGYFWPVSFTATKREFARDSESL